MSLSLRASENLVEFPLPTGPAATCSMPSRSTCSLRIVDSEGPHGLYFPQRKKVSYDSINARLRRRRRRHVNFHVRRAPAAVQKTEPGEKLRSAARHRRRGRGGRRLAVLLLEVVHIRVALQVRCHIYDPRRLRVAGEELAHGHHVTLTDLHRLQFLNHRATTRRNPLCPLPPQFPSNVPLADVRT
ncbi:hypothetical protein Mapa_007186 [Marchantia paleacea]|nr:hypothetical protein Mapa_007186 [Marchantia paleacea]